MNRILTTAALALATGLTLAACTTTDAGSETGAPATSGTPTATFEAPDVTAASGTLIEGEGYTFHVLDGWALVEDESLTAGTDTFVYDTTDTDDFADNLNVILSNAGATSADEIEEMSIQQLGEIGQDEYTIEERTVVGGAETAHVSTPFSQDGVDYIVEQFYPVNDDQMYVVTFSFSSDTSESDRDAVMYPTLASWTWN